MLNNQSLFASTNRYSSLFRYSAYLFAFLPVIGYAVIIGLLSYNLPIFDDYIVQLEMANLQHATHWYDKLTILFSQLNEHRIAYTRFWFLGLSAITGSVPYRLLILVGNASLVGILAIVWVQVRRLNVPVSTWVPVCWLLFQFQFYPNSLWAMGSLQNLTVHFFYLLLFVLILRPGRLWFGAACLTATALVYTSGNGFIAPVLCVLSLVYQRRYRDLLIWIGVILVLVASYFLTYQSVQQFATTKSIDLPTWIAGVMVFLALGVKFPFLSVPIMVAIGVLFLLLAASLSFASIGRLHRNKTRLDRPQYALMVVCMFVYGFVLLSAIVVVRGRWVLGAWDGVIQPRYFFYSTMWMVALYLHLATFFINIIRENAWIVWLVTGVCAVYWALSLQYNLARMFEFRDRALSDYFNWMQVQMPEQQKYINSAFLPDRGELSTVQQIRSVLNQPTEPASGVCTRMKAVAETADSQLFTITGIAPPQSPDDWRYLVMQSPKHALLMPLVYTTNRGTRSFWLQQNLFLNQADCEALTFVAADSSYRIGVVQRNGGKLSVCYSDHYLQPWALTKAYKGK